MQEFLASFAVKIDEAGVSRLQAVLTENRELADKLAEAFGSATAAIRSFSEELGILPCFPGFDVPAEETMGSGRLPVGLDLAQAFSDYEAFTALVKQPVSLKANASGIVSAARSAMSNVRNIFSEPVEVRLKVNSEFYDRRDQSSDRNFDGRNMATVTQIKDLDRCSTIHNSELPPAGGEKRTNSELRIQNSELRFVEKEKLNTSMMSLILSEIPKAGDAETRNINHYSQNVSAPVNIHVTAAGSDPERIGRSLYNTAERYLLRTLQTAKG